MASSSKVMCRLSSRLQALAHNKSTTKPLHFNTKPTLPQSPSVPRVSPISRLPVELGSMMPLYSAVASARLVSSLSIESLGWGLVPQGISMPL